jgi:hypothetical protein
MYFARPIVNFPNKKLSSLHQIKIRLIRVSALANRFYSCPTISKCKTPTHPIEYLKGVGPNRDLLRELGFISMWIWQIFSKQIH